MRSRRPAPSAGAQDTADALGVSSSSQHSLLGRSNNSANNNIDSEDTSALPLYTVTPLRSTTARKRSAARSWHPVFKVFFGILIVLMISTSVVLVWVVPRTSDDASSSAAAYLLAHFPQQMPSTTTIQVTSDFDLKLPWPSAARRTSLVMPLPLNQSVTENSTVDYGGLHSLRWFEEEGQGRAIMHDPLDDRGYEEIEPETERFKYAFDDDTLSNPYVGWEDDTIQNERHCRRTAWHRTVPTNCNSLHELGVAESVAPPYLKYLAAGAYRQVFKVESRMITNGNLETVVLKSNTLEEDKSFESHDLEKTRVDALISERLTSSPRIADIYGFCSLSVLTEYFSGGDLLNKSCKNDRRFTPTEEEKNPANPQNSLTTTEKLVFALEMAEAIAAVHGFEQGVIVHDDIKPGQFLISSSDGHLRLNDFNRAEIMLWDEEHHEYCKYRNGKGHGAWRAPEEYYDKPLDEKIDVWSYGMSLYVVFTGLYPYYHELYNGGARSEVKRGKIPIIDDRYRNRSFVDKEIVEIMESCWAYEPENRTDIFQIVKRLRKAVKENERLGLNATSGLRV